MPFLPLHDRNPRLLIAQPWITWGLIVACVAVYVFEANSAPDDLRRLVLALGMVPASLSGAATLPEEIALLPAPATLLSYQFLHGGWLHLAFNMAYLWVFGDNIEDAMGHFRFVVFFLLCGVLAGLAHLAVDLGSTQPIIGASGAISGVLGAYLLLYPKAKVLVPVIIIPLYLPAYLLILLWVGFQVYSATLVSGAASSDVAWWAHIGGFAAGLILIRFFRHRTIITGGGDDLPTGLEVTITDHRPERRAQPPTEDDWRRGD